MTKAYRGEGDVNEWFRGATDLFGLTRSMTTAPRQDMRKLTVIARRAVEELGMSDSFDLKEEIKIRAATAQLVYNGEMIESALRHAIGIRGKVL